MSDSKNYCSSCDRTFKHHRSYVVHMSKHKGKRYTCDDCGKSYTSSDALVVHRRSHSGSRPYTCPACPVSFVSKSKCRRHKLSHTGKGASSSVQADQKVFICTLCNKVLGSADTLRIHLGKHQGKRYPCSKCDKSYTSSHSLKVHELKHQDVKQWTCSTCGASFMEKRNLVRHEKSHTGTRNEICDVCGKTFVDRSALGLHRKIHEEREPIQCKICGKNLLSPTSLRTHMKLHDTGGRFKCDICSRSFSQKHSLQKHQLLHTKEPKQKALFQAPSMFCGKCDKGFTSRYALRRHLKKHNDGSLKQFNERENRDFTMIVGVVNTNREDEPCQRRENTSVEVRRDDSVTDLKDAFIVYPVSIFNDNEIKTEMSCGSGSLESDQVDLNENGTVSDDDKHASDEVIDHQPNKRRSNRLRNNSKKNRNVSNHAQFIVNESHSDECKSHNKNNVSIDGVSRYVDIVKEENISESEVGQIDMPGVLPSNSLTKEKSVELNIDAEKSDLVTKQESDIKRRGMVSDKSEDKICSFEPIETRELVRKPGGIIEVQDSVEDIDHVVNYENEIVETDDRHVGRSNKNDHDSVLFSDGDFDVDDNSHTNKHTSESLEHVKGPKGEMHVYKQTHFTNKTLKSNRKLPKKGRKDTTQLVTENGDMKPNEIIPQQTTERKCDFHKLDMTGSDGNAMSASELSHHAENNTELNKAKTTTRKTMRNLSNGPKRSCENKTENSNNDNNDPEFQNHGKMKQYVCKQCKKSFTQKSHLNRHIRNITCKNRLKCDLCGCLFKIDSKLKIHLKNVHNQLPYKCPLCDKRYATMSGLNKHKPSHVNGTSAVQPIRRHICDVCGNQYTAASSLQCHMVAHSGMKPFECDVCGTTFGQKCHLLRHKLVVHDGVKKFKCEFVDCGKLFSDSRALKVHCRVHTGDRPYQCEFCEKRFSQPQIRNTHQKTHFDKKEFSCSLCRKEFTTKMSMLRHMKLHAKDPVDDCVSKADAASVNKFTKIKRTRTPVKKLDQAIKCNNCGKKYFTQKGFLTHSQNCKKTSGEMSGDFIAMKLDGKDDVSGDTAYNVTVVEQGFDQSDEATNAIEGGDDQSAESTQVIEGGDYDYQIPIIADVRTSAAVEKGTLNDADTHHYSLPISVEHASNEVDSTVDTPHYSVPISVEHASSGVDSSNVDSSLDTPHYSLPNSVGQTSSGVDSSGVDSSGVASSGVDSSNVNNSGVESSVGHVMCSIIEVEVKSQDELPERCDQEETDGQYTLLENVYFKE